MKTPPPRLRPPPPPLLAISNPDLTIRPPTPLAPGMIAHGNINLNRRPVVHNLDGTISTVRSITVGVDNGRFVLIPTVVGNRVVTNQQAVDWWRKTGQHLGVFRNEQAANRYAQQLHQAQARQYLPGR